jgi:hypothetical protein
VGKRGKVVREHEMMMRTTLMLGLAAVAFGQWRTGADATCPNVDSGANGISGCLDLLVWLDTPECGTSGSEHMRFSLPTFGTCELLWLEPEAPAAFSKIACDENGFLTGVIGCNADCSECEEAWEPGWLSSNVCILPRN